MSSGPDQEVICEQHSEWSQIAATAIICGIFAACFFKGGQWFWGLPLAAVAAWLLAGSFTHSKLKYELTRDTLTLAFGKRRAVLPLASISVARGEPRGHFAVPVKARNNYSRLMPRSFAWVIQARTEEGDEFFMFTPSAALAKVIQARLKSAPAGTADRLPAGG